MNWRLRTITQEAVRNVGGSTARTLVTILAAAGIAGGLSWTEYATSDSLLQFQARYSDQGGYVVVVNNPDGLNTARCEGLVGLPQVVASGAARPGDAVETNLAPGTLFQTASATGGLLSVWAPRQRPSYADLAGGVVVGEAAAIELGLGEGRWLQIEGQDPRQVTMVADTENRAPEAMRWIISPIPPTETATTCWVEFTPTTYDAGIEMLWAGFADSGPQLSVTPYRRLDEFSVDPRQALATRPQTGAWLLIGATLAALTWIGTWFRRAELGLYRAVGTTTPQLAVMIWLETLITLGVGILSGLLWATAIRHAANPIPPTWDQMAIAARNTGSGLLLALVLAPLAVLALGRSNIATQLKDR